MAVSGSISISKMDSASCNDAVNEDDGAFDKTLQKQRRKSNSKDDDKKSQKCRVAQTRSSPVRFGLGSNTLYEMEPS